SPIYTTQINPQIASGGASHRLTLIGFYVLTRMATAIATAHHPNSAIADYAKRWRLRLSLVALNPEAFVWSLLIFKTLNVFLNL
ncbi:MAG: hypothetical protein ACK5WL_26325, partial [Pseudanabaena sp.]